METTIKDNKAQKRFESFFEDKLAFIEYINTTHKIYLTHTEVPTSIGGKGYGSKLVLAVLEEIKKRNLILVPLCPFVALYIKRHPQWMSLVMPGVNIED